MATMLSDLTATAWQLPLCASVSLVLAVLGPPSAHGCYHDAVHVEPGLTQRRRVGLAQTALQHVEKGLTHQLEKPKTNKNTNTQKEKHIFLQLIHLRNCFSKSCTIKRFSYSKWLRVDSHCLMLPPKVEQKVLQRVKVVQVADCCIDHKHHLHHAQRYMQIRRTFENVHKHQLYTCSGQCGGRSSPWWHVPGTRGWRGSLVWSHSLYCSGKDWGAQGPAQTVYHRQIPHCSIGVYTWHGLPNIRTDTKSSSKSYIYKSLLLVSDLAAAVSK